MKTGAFQFYKIGDWAGTSSCRRRLTETGKLSTWSGHEVSGLRTSAFHLYFSFIISGVFLKFLVFDFACCRLSLDSKKFGSVFDLPSIVAPTLDSHEVWVSNQIRLATRNEPQFWVQLSHCCTDSNFQPQVQVVITYHFYGLKLGHWGYGSTSNTMVPQWHQEWSVPMWRRW